MLYRCAIVGRDVAIEGTGAPQHRVRAMFHATAIIKTYDRTVERLEELVGLRVLEYSASADAAVGRRGGMSWIGDGSIELAEPIVEGAAPDRFLQRTGGGMSGLALWVENFAASAAHLDALEVPVPVRFERFGFSSPRATSGLQLEWSEFTVPEDPRIGGVLVEHTRPPLLEVQRLAYVGAVVDDPGADAARLARLMGMPLLFADQGGGPGVPNAAVSLGDCVLALFPLRTRESEQLWGRRHDRPRVSLLAVQVSDLAAARDALSAVGIRLLREAPHLLVLDPDATGDVELAVTDRLLSGDPRLPPHG